MTPCTGQRSRRRSARNRNRQAPRSRCRQVEDSARVSYRDLVVNSHRGQRSRRDRNRTPTTTASAENSTSVTVIPGRSIKRLNTAVTRTALGPPGSAAVAAPNLTATRACHPPPTRRRPPPKTGTDQQARNLNPTPLPPTPPAHHNHPPTHTYAGRPRIHPSAGPPKARSS